MRPSEFLHEWSDRDRESALALSMYENSMTESGIPASVAYDDERGTWLEVEPFIDYAEAAKERWRKANPSPEPGTVLRVVDRWAERKAKKGAAASPSSSST